MSDESVVLDEESMSTVEVKPASDADLDGFDYSEYLAYFPDECREMLIDTLSNHKYGWKAKARALKRIAHWRQYSEELQEQLVEMCTGITVRTRATNAQIRREALANFIGGLNETALRALATQYAVSYDSFMNGNGRNGLTEAILDEMNAV